MTSAPVIICPLCGVAASDSQPYLSNLSVLGKVFGKLPSIVGPLVPVKKLRRRFEHGKKLINVFRSRRWYHCADCSFGYAAPNFTNEELADYYANDFWNIRNALELEDVIYHEDNLQRPSKQLSFIKKNGLKKVRSMLDFGAGMCGATVEFKRQAFCDDFTIVDPSKQARHIAQLLGISRLAVLEGDATKQWELVYSSHSLEHVSDVKRILGRFYASVKHEGYLFIEVPNVPNRTILMKCHHAPHTYCFSEASLVKAAGDAGFELIDAMQYGDIYQDRMHVRHKDLEVPDSLMALFRKKSSKLSAS